MRFVHHPIECKPRGALEGEHFWGNVIRKRACHRREQRAWLKGNGWVTLLCFSPAPSPVCSPSGALLHFPADVVGTRQRPGMPQLQGSSLSPITFPSLLSSPLTQLLQLSCPFLTLTKTWAAFGYWEAYTPPRSLLVSSQIVRSKEIHSNPSQCWNCLSTVSTGSDIGNFHSKFLHGWFIPICCWSENVTTVLPRTPHTSMSFRNKSSHPQQQISSKHNLEYLPFCDPTGPFPVPHPCRYLLNLKW